MLESKKSTAKLLAGLAAASMLPGCGCKSDLHSLTFQSKQQARAQYLVHQEKELLEMVDTISGQSKKQIEVERKAFGNSAADLFLDCYLSQLKFDLTVARRGVINRDQQTIQAIENVFSAFRKKGSVDMESAHREFSETTFNKVTKRSLEARLPSEDREARSEDTLEISRQIRNYEAMLRMMEN